MTLYELSFEYEKGTDLILQRVQELRQAEKATTDSRERRRIHYRISRLEPMLREMKELAVLTRRYYEKGYHKNEKYTQ